MNAKYPVLFIGRGSPIKVIEENGVINCWKGIASGLNEPQAVLCISAR